MGICNYLNVLGAWIKKFKSYLKDHPNFKKLLGLYIIVLAIPITVLLAMRVQNILQHAGGGAAALIVQDSQGNNIIKTSDPNVFLKILLPEGWVTSSPQGNGLVEKSYAQTSCPTITCGTNSGAGGVCEFGSSPNSNVPGCTATCPDGKKVPGFSVSACQSNNCYFNDCTCYPQEGACNSSGPQTATPTPAPVAPECGPTSEGTWQYTCGCNASDGTPGHLATRVCSGGGTWTDPTCYSGTSLCSQAGTPAPVSAMGAPISTSSATPSNQHVLKSITITNSDTDGSTGGSNSITIVSHFDAFINNPIAWKLNPLLDKQNEVARIVQATLSDGKTSVPLVATVLLYRPIRVEVSSDCRSTTEILVGKVCNFSALAYDSNNSPIFNGVSYQWGVSSDNSIGTVDKTSGNITGFYARKPGIGTIWVIARQGNSQALKAIGLAVVSRLTLGAKTVSADLNGDGKVDQADVDILFKQFGRKGHGLSADLNHDGVVDGKDYNILLNSR